MPLCCACLPALRHFNVCRLGCNCPACVRSSPAPSAQARPRCPPSLPPCWRRLSGGDPRARALTATQPTCHPCPALPCGCRRGRSRAGPMAAAHAAAGPRMRWTSAPSKQVRRGGKRRRRANHRTSVTATSHGPWATNRQHLQHCQTVVPLPDSALAVLHTLRTLACTLTLMQALPGTYAEAAVLCACLQR